MAKTTKAFIKSGEDTARLNAERQKSDPVVEAPRAHPHVPDEGSEPLVPEISADPVNPSIALHDPNQPGLPEWEINRAPSNPR